MTDDEVPEELVQAAEHAAELARSTLPAVQAAAQAGGALQSLVGFQAVKLGVLQPLVGFQAVKLGVLQPLVGFQAVKLGVLQPLVGFQAAQLRGALQPLIDFQAAQLGGALRSALPTILASQHWAELDRNVKTMTAWPLAAYADQIVSARNAGLAQLAASVLQQSAPRHHTPSADLTIAPTFTAEAEATKAPDIEPVTAQNAPAEAGRSINVVALAVVLVWLWALSMPAAQLKLPPEAQAYLNSLWPTIAIALTVHLAINDKRKH